MGVKITDIAKKAGVSKATVSRVINNIGVVKEETRQKVLDAIEDFDYRPNVAAQSLAKSASNVIGVVLPDLDNALYAKMYKGISNSLLEYGYEAMLCLSEGDPKREKMNLDMLKSHQVRGALIYPVETGEKEAIPELYKAFDRNTPVISMGTDFLLCSHDQILIDDFRGAYEATATLIKAGHTSIGMMNGNLSTRAARERYRGFCQAMEDFNLEICEKYIFHGEFSTESGGEMTRQLLEMKERPTAIFTADNQITIGCMWCFYNQHLRIPDDIALMAFDDGNILQMVGVDLSTVSIDPEYFGNMAAKMLQEQIQNNYCINAKRLIITPRANLRGSEGKNKGIGTRMEDRE